MEHVTVLNGKLVSNERLAENLAEKAEQERAEIIARFNAETAEMREQIIAFAGEDATKLTPKQLRFLTCYVAMRGQLKHACEATPICMASPAMWRKESEVFSRCYDMCRKVAIDLIESEAVRRAVDGVTKPVFYKGLICGYIQEYSDMLMKTLLEGLKPDTYKHRTEIETKPPNDEDLLKRIPREQLDDDSLALLIVEGKRLKAQNAGK
jgi:hypothetical protein